MLYSLRVIGGAAAIGVPVSEWLIGFSMFIFASLALIKRYIELATRLDKDLPDPSNRNYRLGDMQIVAALAAASGFNAVTVFALYVSSDAVKPLYRHPHLLWLVCPILMYWISRMLMMAHRRLVHDDPIVFALQGSRQLHRRRADRRHYAGRDLSADMTTAPSSTAGLRQAARRRPSRCATCCSP